MRQWTFLLLIISVTCFSCSKKRSGVFKFSGKIVDAYDGQGIDSVEVYIADRRNGGYGKQYLNELTEYQFTSSNGEFSLETGFEKDVKPYFAMDKYFAAHNKEVGHFYKLRNSDFQADYYFEYVFQSKQMEEDEYSGQVIELMRYGTLKLDITKNPNIASDDIQIGFERINNFVITSDTTVYVQMTPDQLNKFEAKRDDATIWNQDFTVGLKGDTATATILL